MPAFRTGTVTTILSERAGLQRVEVDGERAYVLTQLIGEVAVGDRVVMNVTAVEMGLGTGGWHVVHWNLAHDEVRTESGGHIMKVRYTSLQVDTGVAEEFEEFPDDLVGTPVVALALHSQLAPAAAALKLLRPSARAVYVMTDAGALPLALSDLVADLRGAELLDGTVTAGHAFGGDEEAVTVRSALATAKHKLGADVILVGMGPGSVGTGTKTGYSGLEVAAVLNTIADAGGAPIAALRVSGADKRSRHRGVSDHSIVVLQTATHVDVAVPVPAGSVELGDLGRHATIHEVAVPDAVAELTARGIGVSTMGRGADIDPMPFAFAAAAGAYAAACLLD